MRFTLELRGKKYESAKFADRHFFGFMAAIGGTTGLSLLEILNEQFSAEYPNADQFTNGVLKSYPSLQKAEEDLQYLLRRVLPSLTIGADDLDTEDFLGIVTQMGTAYAQSKRTSTLESTPIQQTKVADIKPQLLYPPDVELNEIEVEAVAAAAKRAEADWAIVDCWYRWWKAIDDLDGDKLPLKDALELIIETSGNDFDVKQTAIFHGLITRFMEPFQAVTRSAPIAA